MSYYLPDRYVELAVLGFLRKLEKSCSSYGYIPDVIKELIIAYARNSFSWYTEKHGKGYQFFENNALQAEKTREHFAFLTSSNILSLDMCQKFEWEITIIESKVESNVLIALIIGFIAYPMESSINDWNTYFRTEDHFGIHAYAGNSYLTKYGRDGNETVAKKDERYDIKNGDRFCFRFDFEERKCSFGYNDEFIVDVYTDIPSKIIPTVCIFDPMIFECTKWNTFY